MKGPYCLTQFVTDFDPYKSLNTLSDHKMAVVDREKKYP